MKNVETITKFCSRLGEIFPYPYFFNWSFSTNHRDTTPEGEMVDPDYFIFRVGRYCGEEDARGTSLEERRLLFAPIGVIIGFASFNNGLDPFGILRREDRPIKTFEDLDLHRESVLEWLDSLFRGEPHAH